MHMFFNANFYTVPGESGKLPSCRFALLLPLIKAVAVLGTVSSPPRGAGVEFPLPRADPFFKANQSAIGNLKTAEPFDGNGGPAKGSIGDRTNS